MSDALFPLGRVVATPAALEVLGASGVCTEELLERHRSGDWGDVSAEDARQNRYSIEHGFCVLSSYPAGEERVWIITEADRSSTSPTATPPRKR